MACQQLVCRADKEHKHPSEERRVWPPAPYPHPKSNIEKQKEFTIFMTVYPWLLTYRIKKERG